MEKIERTVDSLKKNDFTIVNEIKIWSNGVLKIGVDSHGEVQKI